MNPRSNNKSELTLNGRSLNFAPPLLKPRPSDSHKGLFGHVLVVGGDHGFGGAVMMAGEAALLSGAGRVTVATRQRHVAAVLTRCPEIMALGIESGDEIQDILSEVSVLVVGPGLGRSEWSQGLLRLCLQREIPTVVDADALNLLAHDRASQALDYPMRFDHCVLTPHPTEAARLLQVDTKDVQSNRPAAAQELQKRYGGVFVRKGKGSLVACPTGFARCDLGNPAMSTAGMGDVLSGVIAALISQGLPLKDAAELAVWAHARAGDLAAEVLGRHIRATELFPYLRKLW